MVVSLSLIQGAQLKKKRCKSSLLCKHGDYGKDITYCCVAQEGEGVKFPKSPLGSATVTMIYESQLMASSSKKFFFVLPLSFVISSFSSAPLCSLLAYCFCCPLLSENERFLLSFFGGLLQLTVTDSW